MSCLSFSHDWTNFTGKLVAIGSQPTEVILAPEVSQSIDVELLSMTIRKSMQICVELYYIHMRKFIGYL